MKRIAAIIFFAVFLLIGSATTAYAAGASMPLPQINIGIGASDDPLAIAPTLQLLFLVSVLTLLPTLLLMLTGFTRIIIVLHFLRSAMGTQQMPPNQVLLGLALFLTIFMMSPVITEINDNAWQPFTTGQITQQEALDRGFAPLRHFMSSQLDSNDVGLFMELAGMGTIDNLEDVPVRVLIPAFILGELARGFMIGFILYLPFIVIDMVVASVLMAMGMMMLPPAMISLPFKILLFILAGGWNIVIRYVMMTFRDVPMG